MPTPLDLNAPCFSPTLSQEQEALAQHIFAEFKKLLAVRNTWCTQAGKPNGYALAKWADLVGDGNGKSKEWRGSRFLLADIQANATATLALRRTTAEDSLVCRRVNELWLAQQLLDAARVTDDDDMNNDMEFRVVSYEVTKCQDTDVQDTDVENMKEFRDMEKNLLPYTQEYFYEVSEESKRYVHPNEQLDESTDSDHLTPEQQADVTTIEMVRHLLTSVPTSIPTAAVMVDASCKKLCGAAEFCSRLEDAKHCAMFSH